MFLNVSKCLLFLREREPFFENFLKIKIEKEVVLFFIPPNQDPPKIHQK
jgi:hypothetical protein